MMPLESSVSDATIWSITLGSSIIILEASFRLIYIVLSAGVTYDDCQLTIEISLQYRPQVIARKYFFCFPKRTSFSHSVNVALAVFFLDHD